jgi:hypothetical protein
MKRHQEFLQNEIVMVCEVRSGVWIPTLIQRGECNGRIGGQIPYGRRRGAVAATLASCANRQVHRCEIRQYPIPVSSVLPAAYRARRFELSENRRDFLSPPS